MCGRERTKESERERKKEREREKTRYYEYIKKNHSLRTSSDDDGSNNYLDHRENDEFQGLFQQFEIT